MRNLLLLAILAVPPWFASQLNAPKWVLLLAIAPFFICAATFDDDPEQQLLGEGFAKYRSPVLLVVLIAGAVVGGLLLLAFHTISGRQ